MVSVENFEGCTCIGKKPRLNQGSIEFGDKDLEVTTQPYDNALVFTASISGFVVKRVLVDQGSKAEVMYPDL